jgi:subtilisin family serine protease
MPTKRRHGSCRRPVLAVALLAQSALGAAPLVADAAPLTQGPAGQVAPPVSNADVIPDQYIVLLSPGADARAEAEDAHVRHGVNVTHVYEHGLRGFAFHGSAQAAEQLKRSGRAQAVSPDRRIHVAAQSLPTGVDRVDADLNPLARIDGVDDRIPVNVAMLDTGIDATHPDLQVVGGTNCIPDFNSALTDLNGHGTATAGVVGALDNGIGVVGVAPGVRLWSVRVMDATGAGTGAALVCGIDWITGTRTDADPTNDIAVVNASVVGPGGDPSPCSPTTTDAVHLAICRSVTKGVVYAAAAGNSAADARGFFPASYPEVITVAAMTDFNGAAGGAAASTCQAGQDDTFASSYSNWGPAVDIVAPGTCIQATWPGGGTAVLTGTSLAAPHVAGAAALYVAAHGMPIDQAGVDAIHQALRSPAGGWAVRQRDAHGFGAPAASDPCHAPMLYLGPPPTTPVHDVSVSALSGPASVTSGNSASFSVGVANDGDVAEVVTVTTTDDSSGVTLDQRTLSLAAAGCASYSVSLSTAGAPAGSRSITARAAPVAGETASADNARTVIVAVTAPPVVVHVSGLSPTATVDSRGNMNGIATVSVASASGAATPNAQVSGTFSNSNKFSVAATCITDATGKCRLQSGSIATSSMTFTLNDVSPAPGGAALTYDPSANVATSVFIKHP